MTILITGAEGQLGRILSTSLASLGNVLPCDRRALDLGHPEQIADVIGRVRPAVIVNCAAFNDVDRAEEQAEIALEINAIAVRSLARAARRHGALLVHFSSDFVFNGSAVVPYTEADQPSPQSVYAASKLIGEWLAQDTERWLVLRVESLFGVRHSPGSSRVGSVDRIIAALEESRPTKVFRDRVVSPSYLIDVAEAVKHLIQTNAESSLYHVVNRGHCTWYELGLEIAGHIGGRELLDPIDASGLALKASRPQFAALSPDKLASAGFVMPTWQDAIERYLAFRATAQS
ncbi:MAG TPA: dTDP-4-dehydrorhamnose reductase [Vicinamibacterales bacterium]|nr:dTDP-4-dehydrorhamnose reductase [Vicinamibacterales bacterium]